MKDKWFWLAIAGIAMTVWMFRWEVHTLDGNNLVNSYAIDRLTGQIWVIEWDEKLKVTSGK